MMRILLLCLVTFSLIGWCEKVSLETRENEVIIKNKHFALHLSKDKGWLLDKVEYFGVGTIMSDFHIYTDWGIYERGYVGSREEKEGSLKIEEKEGEITAIAEGELKREGKSMEEKIRYIVKFKVGTGPRLEVEMELKPEMKPKKVFAFLAQLFSISSVKQWIVNGLDGIISQDMDGEAGRIWESKDEPLNIDNPFIIVMTNWGQVRIDSIRSIPSAQNVFLFNGGEGNLVFFLAFLDGSQQEIGSPFQASYNIEFSRNEM